MKQTTKRDAFLRKASNVINNISFILSILLFLISFRTIKTRVLKRYAAQRRKEWKVHKEEIQRQLDAEHKTGVGTMVIDGRLKTYDPYTAASLRQ